MFTYEQERNVPNAHKPEWEREQGEQQRGPSYYCCPCPKGEKHIPCLAQVVISLGQT
jgi:hypothetical protein